MTEETAGLLAGSQSGLDALHGQLPHGVAIVSADLRLVYANAAWQRCLRILASEPAASGVPLIALFPAEHELHDALRRCLATGETIELMSYRFTGDPGERYWDLSASPIVDEGRVTGMFCMVHEVTARVQAEQAVEARVRLAAFRAGVSQALASSDDVDPVLQGCVEAMVRHAPAAFARIWVLDEADDAYRLRASAGLYTRLNGTYARIPAQWLRDKTFNAHTPAMEVDILRTHQVREPEWAAEQGLVAWASQPLVVRGQIIGFMAMFARQNLDQGTLSELAVAADAIAQFLERKHSESTLREREVVFRSVFETALDGLMIYDLESGQIYEANPAVARMHGYEPEALLRLNRADLLDVGSRERWRAAVEALRAGRDSRVLLVHRRADGSRFHADIQGSSILYRGHPAVLVVIRDVTQELEAQEQLELRVAERTRELSLLLDISRGVTSTLDLTPLLELILDHLQSIVDYSGTAILTRSGDAFVIAGQQGPLPDDIARQVRYPIARLAPVWERLSRGEAIIIPDVRGETAEARVFRDLVGTDLDEHLHFIGSCLWLPLVVKDQLIGLMSITRREPNAFSADRIELATAVARQAAVAIENARLFEQAQGKAALEERQRLARELHDSVSQALYGIGLGTRTARALLDRDPARVAEPLEYVMSLAEAGMAEMRALIFELRPESLELEGLIAALEKQAAAMRSRHALDVDLALLPAEPDISLGMKEALYRIAQEAMHNTAKHARATRIALRLEQSGKALRLEIADNGLGFDSSVSYPGHLGLVSMQERAAPFGGSVTIESAPGAGTRVRVMLPVHGAAPAERA